MTDPSAHHVGVTVSDLGRAVDFYTDTFGFELLAEFSLSGEAFADAVDVSNASGSFAHLDADGVRLELIEYEPAGDALDEPELNRSGAVHFGLSVDDVDVFYDGLDDGVETLSEPRTTSNGMRILFVRDPKGNLIEVLDAEE